MSKTALRLGIAFILLVLSIAAVEFKKKAITAERAAPVKTILGEVLEKGTPVRTQTVERQVFSDRTLVTLTDCNGRTCFELARNEVRKFSPGQAVYSASSGEKIGAVTSVAAQPSYRSGLFPVFVNTRARSGNEHLAAWVETGRHRNVMVIPRTALTFEDGNDIVYKIAADGEIEPVTVTIAGQNATDIWVKSGLNADDVIVTDGQNLIKRYGKVNIINARTGS